MKEIVEKPRSGSLLLKVALLCLVLYFAFLLIHQQMSIAEKQRQLEQINSDLHAQELINNELRHDLEVNEAGGDAYVEGIARSEYDYARSDERVFVNIAGD